MHNGQMSGITTTHRIAESRGIPLPAGDEALVEDDALRALLNPVPDERTHIPFMHRDRRVPIINLRGAVEHFLEFKRDKEKTREVFHIFETLPWRNVSERVRKFLATDRGRLIYATEPSLPEILDDHATLRRLPRDSFGFQYCDYMEREGLTAAGLVAEYEEWRGGRPRLDDQVEWYNDRLRDTHDFLHFLNGFGRDTLGEQCVLAFVFDQRPSPGHLAVAYAGALTIRLNVATRAPVLRAVLEARRLGKGVLPIAEQSILELLPMPTDAVRRKLRIRPAFYYPEVRRMWAEEEGIVANDVLAAPRPAA